MRVWTDYPERITSLKYIYLGNDPYLQNAATYHVQHIRIHQGYGLLKLEGVDDRNQAELLRALLIMVDINDAIPLEDDEIYLYQLIGMRIQSVTGQELGIVSEILETGANDVYIVQSKDYGEILIPATSETVLEINSEDGVITVQLPDGLLPNL